MNLHYESCMQNILNLYKKDVFRDTEWILTTRICPYFQQQCLLLATKLKSHAMQNAMYLAAMTTDKIIEECEILHVSGLLALQEVVMGVAGDLLGLIVMVAVDLVVVVVGVR